MPTNAPVEPPTDEARIIEKAEVPLQNVHRQPGNVSQVIDRNLNVAAQSVIEGPQDPQNLHLPGRGVKRHLHLLFPAFPTGLALITRGRRSPSDRLPPPHGFYGRRNRRRHRVPCPFNAFQGPVQNSSNRRLDLHVVAAPFRQQSNALAGRQNKSFIQPSVEFSLQGAHGDACPFLQRAWCETWSGHQEFNDYGLVGGVWPFSGQIRPS